MSRGARLAGLVAGLVVSASLLAGCNPFATDADRASENVSKAADQFQVLRRIVFYNGITDQYLLTIEGYCSLGNFDSERELTVTCRVPGGYKKHFLGLSDNVTYVVEQIDAVNVSVDHYKVIFKPEAIVPDVEIP